MSTSDGAWHLISKHSVNFHCTKKPLFKTVSFSCYNSSGKVALQNLPAASAQKAACALLGSTWCLQWRSHWPERTRTFFMQTCCIKAPWFARWVARMRVLPASWHLADTTLFFPQKPGTALCPCSSVFSFPYNHHFKGASVTYFSRRGKTD